MALETMNDRAVSWAEIEATANIDGGVELPDLDIKSVDCGSEVKLGQQKKGGKVVAQTTGEATDTASCTLYRSGLRALKRALMQIAPKDKKGRPRLSMVRFDLVINHSFEDESDIHTIKLLKCRLSSNAWKFAEGVEADTVDVALNPLEVVEVIDGQDVVLL